MSNLGNKEIMAQNIKRLMELYQKDRTDICKDLGFKYTTFTDWCNAKTYPRIDKIEMLANYFHVSKADLVEEYIESPIVSTYSLSPKEERLVTDFRILNEDGQDYILQTMDMVKDKYKKPESISSMEDIG